MRSVLPFLLVGVGGCIGSILRYVMTLLFQGFHTVPYGTLVSNITGCFLIGIIMGLSSEVAFLSSEVRLLLATGLCGGFTTFSSFVYELGKFVQDGEYFVGSWYLIGTLTGTAVAFILGTLLTRMIMKG